MAFLRAARPACREWSVEEAAVFAARRDYELLRLLSRDRNALRTARILGLQLGCQQQQQQQHGAAKHAAPQEQHEADCPDAARQRRKRRPPNAARRQKQRERSQQKRLKSKLLAVLPIVHKWAAQQQHHQGNVEMASTSPPASPPYSDCSSDAGPPSGSAARTTQRRSYAAAVVQPAVHHADAVVWQPQQPHVEQRKRDRLREQRELYELEFSAAEAWLALGRTPSPCKAPKSDVHAHACNRRQPAREAPPS
jgi:hypothetical protein